jgi:hypothetical protein
MSAASQHDAWVQVAESYVKACFFGHEIEVYPLAQLVHAADGSGRSFPDVRVLRIAPRGERDFWIYVSAGASTRAVDKQQRLEFFTLAPLHDYAHVENMTVLIYYQLASNRALAQGHVCPIGRAWVKGSNLDHFLISYANPIRNELEFVHSNLGCIKFYWAQPIHSEEAKFLRTSEIAQLEEAFERASINIVGLMRDPVV